MAFLQLKGPAAGRNPHLIVCHLCGREFGSKSISIHLKACEEKWHRDQAALPKSKRRPMPVAPSFDLPISPSSENKPGAADNTNYNDAAYESYMGARSECPHCGRKFAGDRLEVHLRSCQPGGFFAKHRNVKETLQHSK